MTAPPRLAPAERLQTGYWLRGTEPKRLDLASLEPTAAPTGARS